MSDKDFGALVKEHVTAIRELSFEPPADSVSLSEFVNDTLDRGGKYSKHIPIVKHCAWLRGAAEAVNITISDMLDELRIS